MDRDYFTEGLHVWSLDLNLLQQKIEICRGVTFNTVIHTCIGMSKEKDYLMRPPAMSALQFNGCMILYRCRWQMNK